MNNKYNNKSGKFIQGLRPFSSSIPKTLKKYLKKGGYNYSNIVDNWTKMVSKKISDSCYPISIRMGKEMRDGTLILNVVHGKELDIEYEKQEIVDQINSFYGYSCINKIVLKIIKEKSQNEKEEITEIKNFLEIKNKIEQIDNNELKSSLNNFLKSYNARNK